MSCGCESNYLNCDSNSCPVQLDFDCVFYHVTNSEVSNLTCLNLTNGATLGQFAEAVDSYICQLKVLDFTLPCLRSDYTVNNLKQFAEAVDTEICSLSSSVATLQATINTPVIPIDTFSINLTASGTANHTLQADVIIDPATNNRLSVSGTGLLVAPQVLQPDYVNKTLAVTGANNIVQMSSFFTTVSGYLGPLATDPAGSIAGQMWYNTTASQLKFNTDGSTIIILN
jgi:hypothetical protein